ncbi:MAG: hypothetical protein HY513_04585 [Candidatus Aenigmarchaeota archaeon]|nr:hypothetical protein [Candidatus Aenigmarchaeota archaeon]
MNAKLITVLIAVLFIIIAVPSYSHVPNGSPVLSAVSPSVSEVRKGTLVDIYPNKGASDPDGDACKIRCGAYPSTLGLCESALDYHCYFAACAFTASWTDEGFKRLNCVLVDEHGAESHARETGVTVKNKPEIVSASASPSEVRKGTVVAMSSVASDPLGPPPRGEKIKLLCGTGAGLSNLCSGALVNSNPSCAFTAAWSDEISHVIYCRVRDASNFQSSDKTVTVSAKNKPVLTSVTASPVIIKSGAVITIASVASDPLGPPPAGEKIKVACGSSPGSTDLCISALANSNPSCSFASPWADEASHVIYCKAVDESNFQSGEKTASIKADNTQPAVSVSHAPKNPSTPSSSAQVTLTAVASDLNGISSIKIYTDALLVKTCTTSPCMYTGDFPLGTHLYYSIAEDNAGNIGRDPVSGTKSFTVVQAVEIIAADVSNSCPLTTDFIDVICTSSVANVNCVGARIGSNECIWGTGSRWEGNTAVFANCAPGLPTTTACGTGSRDATCYIKTNLCVQIGENKIAKIDVQRGPDACYDYTDENSCTADPLCQWVNLCSESKTLNPEIQCISKTSTPAYQCKTASCSAECDGSGGCPAKLLGDVCYYSGICKDACLCAFSEQHCPVPGTVSGKTCYYGSQSCDETGCTISTCTLAINNRCDADAGCIVDNSVVEMSGNIDLSDKEPAAGDKVDAEIWCQIRNKLYGFAQRCLRDNTDTKAFNVDQETGIAVLGNYEAENSRVQDCGLDEHSVNLCSIGDSIKINQDFNPGVATFKLLAQTNEWVNITLKVDGVPKTKRSVKLGGYDSFYISADMNSGVHDVEFVLSDKQSANSKINIDAVAVVSGVVDYMSKEDWIPWQNWDSSKQVWTAQIDTDVYHSTLEVNESDRQTGVSGVFTNSYSVRFVRRLDVTVKFPDQESKTIPTINGKPVFYKPMQIEFIAEGKVKNIQSGEQQNCNGDNCIAAFSLDNGPFVPVSYDEFAGAFAYKIQSVDMRCNTEHSVKVKITKTTQPEEGASGISERLFALNCETVMLVSPPEKRTALGFSGLAFQVMIVNPDSVDKNYDLEISLPRSEFMLSNLQFRCTDSDQGCNIVDSHKTSLNPTSNSVASVSLYANANRAGIYPIDFETTGSNEFSEQATLQVFAESLPEFSVIQLIIAMLVSPLIYFVANRKKVKING